MNKGKDFSLYIISSSAILDKILSNKVNCVVNNTNHDASDNSNLQDSSSSRPANHSHRKRFFTVGVTMFVSR
jgi:hypothetical protein